jgi:sortase A
MRATAMTVTFEGREFPPTLRGRDREGGAPHASGPGTAPLLHLLPPSLGGKCWGGGRHLTVIAVLLALIGLVLFGQGIWIHAKALLAQVLLERAFATTVATGEAVKPWSWADTWPVARIAVPRLRTRTIALAGSSGQALAFGPGHVERTPEAGERGIAVYAAHRDTHFAFLKDVHIGDEIVVTRRDGAQIHFVVTATSVVRWDASGLDPLSAGRHLVLATCWPFGARTPGPLRYLVHAEAK